MKKIFSLSWLSLFVLAQLVSSSAQAIGPRAVTSLGFPVKWETMPISVQVESDTSVRGKDVSPLIQDAIDTWVDLSDSDVTVTLSTLSASVDDTNVCSYFYDSRACPSGSRTDGVNPLVIDEDGAITAAFFGTANKFTTLGFASIINYDSVSGAAVKGEAVFNAACLSGVMVSGCSTLGATFTGFTDDDFTSFIVHEFGHFLGLDHSQVNLTEATDSLNGSGAVDSNDNLINTMFPTFIIGNGANFKIPKRDDQVALAQLYPNSSFTTSTWTIEGTVYGSDGAELQCANVVARNVDNTKVDAIAALTGDFSASGTADGSFIIPGLTAGETYQLDVESIGSRFTGASGYTPCRGTGNSESSPPQFTKLTSTITFTGSAESSLIVDCHVGGDCAEVTPTAGGGGGCSLIPE